jgi:hypothetical protein
VLYVVWQTVDETVTTLTLILQMMQAYPRLAQPDLAVAIFQHVNLPVRATPDCMSVFAACLASCIAPRVFDTTEDDGQFFFLEYEAQRNRVETVFRDWCVVLIATRVSCRKDDFAVSHFSQCRF